MCIYGVYVCVLVEQEAIRDKELQKKDKTRIPEEFHQYHNNAVHSLMVLLSEK